ncbi:MAG TPA: SDR family NAD(P)-dependent oxidoreductase [Pseudonocardiaceae bacterium]|nr:SDR family NAD(P)-dependent oxidoreductase [Pseudonocardiaceae bacterium]
MTSKSMGPDELTGWLTARVAALTELTVGEVQVDRAVHEFGLSSRNAVTLATELSDVVGRALGPTFVYQHPSIASMVAALTGDSAAAPGVSRGGVSDAGEPIAVIGVDCRLPGGVESAGRFWNLLDSGRDVIGSPPEGRWPAETQAPLGGYLDDVAGFDAAFFGITPREAAVMDPQQRIVLEVAWAALEQAGIAPGSLRGSRTGVFMGVSATEYGSLSMADIDAVDAWSATGAAGSVIANRLSYLLDLRGASVVVDTACSSSLVAVHQAVRALRAGEIDLAVVGGVNTLLTPAVTAAFGHAGVLAPDGRCKAFDASANGIARGEGCGVVILRRLSDARRADDRVLALIRGSGTNSDGRSNGLMAPNPEAQAALLRDVYTAADVDPATVDYVEAHGTGTLLGDPIEAAALGEVLGAGRSGDRPLLLGSVKTNLGHLEGAAGIVGLIKVVLALANGRIPASLHYHEPNPLIDFDALKLSVAATPLAWPRYSGLACAGVSAFGFGGSNAHVVMEEWSAAPPMDSDAPSAESAQVFALSAMSEAGVRARAADLAEWILSPAGRPVPLADVAAALVARRDHLTVRAAVVAANRDDLAAALRALAAGEPSPAVTLARTRLAAPRVPETQAPQRTPPAPVDTPHPPGGGPVASLSAPTGPAKGDSASCGQPDSLWTAQSAGSRVRGNGPGSGTGPVFVFSGYGSQWAGMGRRLLAAEPDFRRAVVTLAPSFRSVAGFSLREALGSDEMLTDLSVLQPVLFGMQVALAEFWRAQGVHPAAVVGHSMGEIAAAVVAGALDVEQGLRIVTARSRLLAGVDNAGQGAMAVVELSATELAALRAEFPDVSIAVYGAPAQCTVGGPPEQIDALVRHAEALGRLARKLPVGGAGHSAAVEPLLAEFRAAIAAVEPTPPRVPCYSSVLDDPRAQPRFDIDYWAANLRRPVRFTQALAATLADGHRTFVEIAPHPIAIGSVEQTAAAENVGGVLALGSLNRKSEQDGCLPTVAALHAHGHADVLTLRYPRSPVLDLPGPAWQHERHWIAAPSAKPRTNHHPLLDSHVAMPDGRHAWQADIGTEALPWLADHQAYGVSVLPATGYLEMARSAGRTALGVDRVRVENLDLRELLPLSASTEVTTVFEPVGAVGAGGRVTVSAPAAGGGWTLHATAFVRPDDAPPPNPLGSVTEGEPLDLYPVLARSGQQYGPAFRGLRDVRAVPGRASASVTLPDPTTAHPAFGLHPALADACLHALVAAGYGQADSTGVYLPRAIGSAQVYGDPARGVRCDAVLRPVDGGQTLVGTVQLVGPDEEVLAEIADVRAHRMSLAELPADPRDLGFELRWKPDPLPPAARRPRAWLLATDGTDDTDKSTVDRAALADLLAEHGDRATPVHGHDRPDDQDIGDIRPSDVVLIAGPADDYTDPARARQWVHTAAAWVRELERRSDPTPRLWFVTVGGTAVDPAESGAPGLGCLRALVRVLAFEHPELRASLVDLGAGATVDHLADELRADSAADEVAWRGDVRYTARLARTDLAQAESGVEPAGRTVRPGAYLITGGLGELGLRVARWLVAGGARRVVLSGRHGPSPATIAVLGELRANGTEIDVVPGDIAEPGVARRLVDHAQADGLPLYGVVHAAGVLADRLAIELTEDDLMTVWRPKVLGGAALHEATADVPLDWWLVFSSVAALFGSPGQAAYATANAWLDGLVADRRRQGLPATTIQWGAWERADADGADRANAVLAALRPEQGVAAMETILAGGRAATGVARVDLATTLDLYPELASRPFLADLLAGAGPTTVDGSAGGDDWPGLAAVRRMAPDEGVDVLRNRLANLLAGLIGTTPDRLDQHLPLTQLGLDSLMAMRMRAAVQHDLGVPPPVSALLRGASLADVADELAATVGITVPTVPSPPGPQPTVPSPPGPQPTVPTVPTPQPAAAQPNAERIPAAPAAHGPIGPRDATERWLALLWRDVLGRNGMGVHDDFFAVGGDDVLADQVRALIADRIGDRGPVPEVESLFANPTIAVMADLLRSSFEDNPHQMVVRALRAEGADVPLHLFHPAGGPTSVYQPLIAALPNGRPCYGYERLDDVDTVEDKAARYVELLREIQPDGPYLLGGWSFGGCLAYEVASVLTKAGQRVSLVAMIDSILPLPAPNASPQVLLLERFARFAEHVEHTYGVRLDISITELSTLDEPEQIRFVLDRLSSRVPDLGEAVLRHQYTSYVDARVSERYQPRPYDGRVLLLRAADQHQLTTSLDPRYLRTDEALGWDELCADLRVVRVPGDHVTMIDPPNVAVLAHHLADALGSAEHGRKEP